MGAVGGQESAIGAAGFDGGRGDCIRDLDEEATVKRFFLRKDHVALRPENPDYEIMRYGFGEVLIQGKVIGIQRGTERMERL